MATDLERELFESEVLNLVREQRTHLCTGPLTGFLAMAGQAYDGRLMVVGRAVNGWKVCVSPDQLRKPGMAERFARGVQDSVSGEGQCPMRWVTGCWGRGGNYSTKRSAFWRGVRNVVHGLGIADVGQPGWSSHLVWSNLYKVSPAGGGNPNRALRQLQFPGCAALLNLELRTYQPVRVLYLTGADWAAPFTKEAEPWRPSNSRYVQGAFDADGARHVIAVHPQGKPGTAWAREIIAAFDRGRQRAADAAARRH